MEMVLTGEQMAAQEALLRGLVSRVVSKEKSLQVAIDLAKNIADRPRLISKF
jgi:enoyl-CoA hydratase/carnithine racemase